MTVAAVVTSPRRPSLPLRERPVVSNARLGVAALIAAETMLFTALVGMYLVVRLTPAVWPPPGLPTLPIAVTAVNTGVLLASMLPMAWGLRALRAGRQVRAGRLILFTLALGATFLAIQGFEWSRLVLHGLTLQTGAFGGAFYVLIGCHALHVLGAVAWLAVVTVGVVQGRFTASRDDAVEACAIFWFFVCLLWAFLFPLAYLY